MHIYIIKNTVNDKVYIGQTIGTIEKRWQRHLCRSEQENDIPLYRAMKKYGAEKFYILELFEAESANQFNELEKGFIEIHNSMVPNGYNAREGGSGGRLSQESIDKMSATKRGKKLSSAHKEKLSKVSLGKKKTKQHAASISAGKSKPIIDELGVIYPSTKIAAQLLKLKAANITKVLNGQRKTTGGHTFKFVTKQSQRAAD